MLSRIALARASQQAVGKVSPLLLRATFATQAPNSHLIINAVGQDRLGIVSEITKHVTDAGGNVGASQAAKLGGHFSLMMLVDLPQSETDNLQAKLQTLNGLSAAVYETDSPTTLTPKIAYSGRFKLEGADNPGIVHKLTTFMAHNGLSVDKMETSDDIAPHGGTQLFKMKGVATAMEPLAGGFDIERIKTELRQLGDSLNCDISMEDMALKK